MKQLHLQKKSYWNRNLGEYDQPYEINMRNFRFKKNPKLPPKSKTSPNNNSKSITVLHILIKTLLIILCSLQGKGRFVFAVFIYARCSSENLAQQPKGHIQSEERWIPPGRRDYRLQADVLNILTSVALFPFLWAGRKKR